MQFQLVLPHRQDKLAELKRQLEQLQEGALPEYTKRLRRLEANHKERVRVNAVIRELEEEMVEQDFINEKKASAREYEEHKASAVCARSEIGLGLGSFQSDGLFCHFLIAVSFLDLLNFDFQSYFELFLAT